MRSIRPAKIAARLWTTLTYRHGLYRQGLYRHGTLSPRHFIATALYRHGVAQGALNFAIP
jgi:hypothetical protein